MAVWPRFQMAALGLFCLSCFGAVQALSPDVTGVWDVVFETPMGERTYATTFVQEKNEFRVAVCLQGKAKKLSRIDDGR